MNAVRNRVYPLSPLSPEGVWVYSLTQVNNMSEIITQGTIITAKRTKVLTTVTKNRLGYCAYVEIPKSAKT